MSIFSTLAHLLGGTTAGSTLSPIELKELLAGTAKPVLIDVRTAQEVKGGRISGAKHIDLTESGFSRKVDALPREGTYVLYCLSGGRSGRALSAMKGMGFQDVRHLGGGIGSWKAAGYPLAK
jgi:rhodanese-related sulfurtransferase